MGWQIGFDEKWQRDIGYGVPALCDHPDCETKIDRGLSYVCSHEEPYGGDGCGLYFCSEHRNYIGQCQQCWNEYFPFKPKPDVEEWLKHKATDSSWAQWRAEQKILESWDQMTSTKALKVINESGIVYEGWEGIPTIELGTGTALVSSLFFPKADNPGVGIGFAFGGNGNIGEFVPEKSLIEIHKAGGFLQIVATSPEALDVLIRQAEIAKTYFNKENWPVIAKEEQKNDSK